jgi:hypothetical protein
MKRAALALPVALFLAALAWPITRGADADAAAGVCTLMTRSRMLEHPALAHELAEALRSGDADELGRVEDMLREIRSAHGCEGDVATPAERVRPALPPGHPPIHGPFIDHDRTPEAPLFEAPGTVTI